MPRRRGKWGQGGITKRPNGRYQAQWSSTEGGKRVRTSATFELRNQQRDPARTRGGLDWIAGARLLATMDALASKVEAALPIARLSDDDVRDYEQGLCFFCGAGHEVIPGPRGGVTGRRRRRPIHEPTCSWAALRTALGED